MTPPPGTSGEEAVEVYSGSPGHHLWVSKPIRSRPLWVKWRLYSWVAPLETGQREVGRRALRFPRRGDSPQEEMLLGVSQEEGLRLGE